MNTSISPPIKRGKGRPKNGRKHYNIFLDPIMAEWAKGEHGRLSDACQRGLEAVYAAAHRQASEKALAEAHVIYRCPACQTQEPGHTATCRYAGLEGG